ncbi:MAG: hypothetical protein P8N04_05750 [Schleiferiaceae bacterium]|nr:hypothetical protein [Schleiferiaceae bacterium]
MKRFIYSLIAVLAWSLSTDAQTVIVRKRNLNTAQGAGTISSQSPSTSLPLSGSLYYSRYNHAIKLSPTAMLAGDVPIAYEYKISDYMSAEAGIGVTTFNITEEAIRGYSLRQDGQTQSKLGYSGNVNVKFFPEGNAFEDGYYISYTMCHRNYAQDFYTTTPAGIDTTVSEGFNWTDFGFTIGYQSRPSERMIVDWFIGGAIRQKQRRTSDYVEEFDPVSGIFTGEYRLIDSKNAAPAILGGMKISILFR